MYFLAVDEFLYYIFVIILAAFHFVVFNSDLLSLDAALHTKN